MLEPRHHRLWRSTRRVTGLLLLIWLLANLLAPWFAHSINGVKVAGLPMGYWLAAQGLLLLYLFIIVVYVVCMDRLERRFTAEGSPEAEARAAE